MAGDLEYELNVNTGSSAAQVKALASALSGLSDQLRDVGRNINGIANNAEKIERGLAGMSKQAQQTTKSLQDLNKVDPFKATREKLKFGANPDFAQTRQALGIDLEAKAAAQEQKKLNDALREEINLRKQAVAQARAARLANAQPYDRRGAPAGQMVPARPLGSEGIYAAQKATEAYNASLVKKRAATLAAAQADLEHMNRLTNLRYTLYDVQRSFLVLGLGTAVASGLVIKAAMDYETAMAQISRTSGISGDALSNVRDEFTALAREVPTAFSNLAEIGTLGGQLNIPAERLEDFTRTVAQFTATTNVAVEQSATAFGRLDALLPDVQGNYEALGSSILNVGINSVATETEIINTTNQIAAAGQQAGFAADQIIGLAASYASLGVAPEAARGTTIRFFSEINTAISEGGAELEQFAQLSGKTSQQFVTDWEANAGDAFIELLTGMNKLQASGENLESVLRSMGITAVRDINALLKLAQNSEIVANNFGYAAQGFDDATQLGKAFEVQAATLASQLQMLINAVQGLFAELGQSAVPILSSVVGGLTDFVGILTELAKNPALQYATVITGIFLGLVTVLGVLGFAFTRLLSATIAIRTAFATMRAEALAATGGVTGLTAATRGLTAALFGASTGAKVLRGALLTTGIGAAFVAAGFVIDGVITSLDKLKPASEQAKAAFGDLTDLTSALKADTEAVKDGASSFGEVTGELFRTTEATEGWAWELERATGVQTQLDGSIRSTTSSMGEQTYQIGANTVAWLANKLATDETLANFLKFNQEMRKSGDPTLNTQGFITALTKNDVAEAERIVQEYKARLQQALANEDIVPGESSEIAEGLLQVEKLNDLINVYNGAVQGAANSTEVYNSVMQAAGVSAEDLARAQGDVADEAANTATQLSVLRDTIEAAFSNQNLLIQMSNDFYALASGIVESGTAMDYFSRAGVDNLTNFQTSIASVIAAGESLGISTTDSVAALFLQLQRMGIDTAVLLAQVANIPGINAGAVEKRMQNLSGNGAQLADVLNRIAGQAQQAGASLGGGGSSGGGGGGRQSTAQGARQAAQEIRTLIDYANDLSGVFQRSFSLRFGSGQAMDRITSSWIEIREATNEAALAIQKINAEMATLKADRSTALYFLGVAENYNDTLRAAEIRADLAEIDAELADSQKDLQKEQTKTNKTLVGNSKAAIANRGTIEDLVSQYHDLIESYASSGMSQGELAQKTAQLRAQFIQQATQLGFNRNQVETYARSFDDVALSIQRVPRNVTVAFNPNPALQALAEFSTKATKAVSNLGSSVGGALGGSIRSGIQSSLGGLPFASWGWGQGISYGTAFKRALDEVLAKAKVRVIPGGTLRFDSNGQMIEGNVGNLRFFKTGGYTGGVSANQAAGVVHGREFVVNAENTAKFRPILEAMNRGHFPMAYGGAGTSVVELSAYDRALLAQAGNVQLSIDGRVVASASNSANFVSTKRGTN
jgi:TP901 family phage tail tape measure protein